MSERKVYHWKKKTGKEKETHRKYTKLTAAQVMEIRMIWAKRISTDELADMYGVTKTTISLIVNQHLWKDLPSVDSIRKGEYGIAGNAEEGTAET